jgi:hypothetical protein
VSVAETSMFSPMGGRYINGSTVTSYASISALKGAGQLLLASPLIKPLLQADWKFGGGTPVRPFVQVDDVESQAALGLVELDRAGRPTDGVHEYTIDDDALATVEQMTSRGLAELQLFSRPIQRIAYSTRDPKTAAGKLVHVDLQQPPCVGDFIIQEVTIDQYHDVSDALAPRRNVQADSAARFNFNDFMLYLDDRSGRKSGSASLSGLLDSAQSGAEGSCIPIPTVQRRMPAYYFMDGSGAHRAIGNAFTQQGPSPTMVVDADGIWSRSTTTVGVLSCGHLTNSGNLGFAWWDHDPLFDVIIRTGPNVLGVTWWVVLLTGAGFYGPWLTSNPNYLQNAHIGVRCNPNQDGAWIVSRCDGMSQTDIPSGEGRAVVFKPSTQYRVRIWKLDEDHAMLSLNGQETRILLPDAMRKTMIWGFVGFSTGGTNPSPVVAVDLKAMYLERN